MKELPVEIEGLKLFELDSFGDERGFFRELYQEKRYKEFGVDIEIKQINHSRSTKGILRGLHAQLNPTQGKLISVATGKILDVAVDVRPNSPTFGRHQSFEISDENHRQLYIPAGFLHGFVTLSDSVDFLYGVTDLYNNKGEFGVIWSDPTLNIRWVFEHPKVSERDEKYPPFKSIDWEKIVWK